MSASTETENSEPDATHRMTGVDLLCVLLVIVVSALAMAPNVADPDLWGHIQFGRDVLATQQIADTTSYSFTAEGYRWINHENLSEIVMALVADTAGPVGLMLGKFLLSLLVILGVFRTNLRQGNGLIVASIMTLLVATNLGYHWSIRPQISSFICFTLLLLLFQYSFSGWRGGWHLKWRDKRSVNGSNENQALNAFNRSQKRALWLLIPLFFIWANAHGGFLAGVAVAVTYLGLRAFEVLLAGGHMGRSNHNAGLALQFAGLAVAIILTTLVNPYGSGLQTWLLQSLGSPRPEISDWSTNPLLTGVGMKLWMLIGVAAIALIGSKKKHDATESIILALLVWQALSHFRHTPFLAIAIGFWVGPHLKSVIDRTATAAETSTFKPAYQRLVQIGLLVFLIGSTFLLGQRLSDLQVKRDQFPVDAIDFMRQNRLHGKLVVSYDWAQYSIAALCSEAHLSDPQQRSRVAFDGRFRTCYPQSIIDMHFDFLYGHAPHMERHRDPHSPPIDPARVLRFESPDLVLLKRQGERTEKHMYENTDHWVLLYQDGIAQVWGRRSTYDTPSNPSFFAVEKRVIHNTQRHDSVTWPAIRPIQPNHVRPKQTAQFINFANQTDRLGSD